MSLLRSNTSRDSVGSESIKVANRLFYDTIGGSYEEIDGRRSPSLRAWLREKLRRLQHLNSASFLLDLGTGSGLVTRCAKGLFDVRVGVDLSSGLLAAASNSFDLGVAADVDELPFRDQSFDLVTCFAVLHHLYSFEGLVSEVYRVLRPGGLFYADHDMDEAFARRFRMPLKLYRRIHDSRTRYMDANPAITPELYSLTEWHQNGIDSSHISCIFRQAGFILLEGFHWFGLVPLLDKLFGARSSSRGWSPLFSLIASKPSR